MGLQPEGDYDLGRKVEFMKRLRNSSIANKIIKSQQFKEYNRYSLQSCFAKALELEGEFMVGEVVAPRHRQATILGVEGLDPTGGEGACEVKHHKEKGISTTRMSVQGAGVWDILHEIVLTMLIRPQRLASSTTHWKQRPR